MKNEIGSFFEAYEIPENVLDEGKQLPKWWYSPDLELVCSGREAIEAALIDIQCSRPEISKVCILPQYTCDTVIVPFQKHDWEIYFYPVLRNLTVDTETFEQLLTRVQPGVLLMHTYYGVDTIKAVRPLITEWQAKRKLIFIEDMTQSLGLWNSTENADYYVGSLRKWFPIPDGGFIYSDHKFNVKIGDEKTEFVRKKSAVQKMKLDYLHNLKTVRKDEILRLNYDAEKYLYDNGQICKMSGYSKVLLKKIDVKKSLCARKENAEYLRNLIGRLGTFEICTDELESGPLYLPIYVEKRELLQKWLKEANIFAPVLWPAPDNIGLTMTEDVRFIFGHLLALPCDQRYNKSDMERIFDRICRF